jgi:hypothetical protein
VIPYEPDSDDYTTGGGLSRRHILGAEGVLAASAIVPPSSPAASPQGTIGSAEPCVRHTTGGLTAVTTAVSGIKPRLAVAQS